MTATAEPQQDLIGRRVMVVDAFWHNWRDYLYGEMGVIVAVNENGDPEDMDVWHVHFDGAAEAIAVRSDLLMLEGERP